MQKRLVIALDGPSGSGKSTLARRLASALGYLYIDSGAMYRAIGLKALRNGVSLDDEDALALLAEHTQLQFSGDPLSPRISMDGEDVSIAIRSPEATEASSRVSVFPRVRRALVRLQQSMGAAGGVVMDGRDIGTKVFPRADVKFFVTARDEVRAQRRLAEDLDRGISRTLEETLAAMRERDRRDSERAASPLVQAEDAIPLDNSDIMIDEALAKMLEIVKRDA